MNTNDAVFELTLMNAEESTSTFDDFFIWGTEKGIPPEILTRLKKIWDFTQDIAGEVISIGRIIVSRIIQFLKDNPQLTVGIALGAAVGFLSSSLPFIGPLLAPLATTISAIYGAGVGAALEMGESTSDATSPTVAAISLAKKFLELIVEVLKAVASYFKS